MEKTIIYQVFTRLYGNRNATRQQNGTIEENGCGKFNDLTPARLRRISELGVSHVWYTGVIRHASQTDYTQYGIPRQHPAVVKGRAGSPYAITDYYDVDPDLAVDVTCRMQEFEKLVQRTHKAGMKVIIDFVPNHVARQYHSICKPDGVEDLGDGDDRRQGFSPQNNFYYCPGERFSPGFDLYHGEAEPYLEEPARATGNDCFHCSPGMNDWYETVKLNYGVDYYAGRVGYFDPVPSTWQKMLDILLFWAGKDIDGFRCDMAEMVPSEFWAWATSRVKQQYPQLLFVGEVYNPQEYRRYIASGFDLLYDKVGMYDTLREVTRGHRSTHDISHAWQQTDDIGSHMLYFLENHDEQRIASDFFAADGRRGIPALVASVLMQQNPFMLYAGQELGERGMDCEGFSGHDGRTTIFDYWSVDTLVREATRRLNREERLLRDTYQKVLSLARTEKAVTDGLFFDLMYANPQLQQQYVFLRKAGRRLLVVAVNFSDSPDVAHVNLPGHAFDYLNMGEHLHTATDLMTGATRKLELRRDAAIELPMDAWGFVVLSVSTSA